MIADYEGDITKFLEQDFDGEMPILATRNIVLFPGVFSPIIIGRSISLNLINKIRKNPDQIFAIFCQKNQDINEPSLNDLFEYGVFAKLGRVLEIPGQGDTITAIIQGLGRCHLDELTKKRPYLVGQVSPAREELPTPNDREYFTAVADLRIRTREYIKENEDIPDESEFAMNNIQNDILCVNFVCSNMPFSINDKFQMLKADSMIERVIITLKAFLPFNLSRYAESTTNSPAILEGM